MPGTPLPHPQFPWLYKECVRRANRYTFATEIRRFQVQKFVKDPNSFGFWLAGVQIAGLKVRIKPVQYLFRHVQKLDKRWLKEGLLE